MAIYHDTDEPLDIRLRKKQKHLRAKLRESRYPSWLESRLLQDAGITEADLTAILCTTAASAVLTAEQLDAVELFIRRYEAGGITEDGAPPADPPSIPKQLADGTANGVRFAGLARRFDRLTKFYGFRKRFAERAGITSSDYARLATHTYSEDMGRHLDTIEAAIAYHEQLEADAQEVAPQRPPGDFQPPPRPAAPDPEPPAELPALCPLPAPAPVMRQLEAPPADPDITLQTAILPLSDDERRRIEIQGPVTITRHELKRLQAWLEVQFIITENAEVSQREADSQR